MVGFPEVSFQTNTKKGTVKKRPISKVLSTQLTWNLTGCPGRPFSLLRDPLSSSMLIGGRVSQNVIIPCNKETGAKDRHVDATLKSHPIGECCCLFKGAVLLLVSRVNNSFSRPSPGMRVLQNGTAFEDRPLKLNSKHARLAIGHLRLIRFEFQPMQDGTSASDASDWNLDRLLVLLEEGPKSLGVVCDLKPEFMCPSTDSGLEAHV